MRGFGALVFLGFLVACSSVRVNYDYDKGTDFSKYSTYNYFMDMETGLSQLDEKRLFHVLDSTLQTKGLLLAEEPDLLINIISQENRDTNQNAVGIGLGGTNRTIGGGVSVGIPIGGSQLQRIIQFDLVDNEKNALIWQAISKSAFRPKATPEVREEQLKKVVDEVFSSFPPQS